MPPNTPELRLVVETRPATYPPRRNANPRMRKANRCARCRRPEQHHGGADHPFRSPADDPGGAGWEIVRELRVCRACHEAAG